MNIAIPTICTVLAFQGISLVGAIEDFDIQPKVTIVNEFDYANSIREGSDIDRKVKILKSTEFKESTEDGEKYKASLAKEKAKSDAIAKKTKEERRKDLCESLGRGC
jgi:hypothetical protein